MQKNGGRPVCRAGFGIADIQDAGVDLLQRAKRRIHPGLDRVHLAGLRVRGAADPEPGGGNGERRVAQNAAATVVDFCGHGSSLNWIQIDDVSQRFLDAATRLATARTLRQYPWWPERPPSPPLRFSTQSRDGATIHAWVTVSEMP